VDAIAGLQYHPAECNGQPVQVETVVRVNYELSPIYLKASADGGETITISVHRIQGQTWGPTKRSLNIRLMR
jgi:hypothetical protein